MTERLEEVHSSDFQLVADAAKGDVAAQRTLANRLLERVRTTVAYLRIRGDHNDDIVSAALEELLRSYGSFRGESRLETWADRITVRTAMRFIKKERFRGKVVTLVPEPPPSAPGHAPQQAQRTRRRLAEHLEKIAPERRAALVLKLVHGYSVAEIAEMAGVPENTVRDRLRTGRRQLRKFILKDPFLHDRGSL